MPDLHSPAGLGVGRTRGGWDPLVRRQRLSRLTATISRSSATVEQGASVAGRFRLGLGRGARLPCVIGSPAWPVEPLRTADSAAPTRNNPPGLTLPGSGALGLDRARVDQHDGAVVHPAPAESAVATSARLR